LHGLEGFSHTKSHTELTQLFVNGTLHVYGLYPVGLYSCEGLPYTFFSSSHGT
jgi:hypothetical protein